MEEVLSKLDDINGINEEDNNNDNEYNDNDDTLEVVISKFDHNKDINNYYHI